MDEAAIKYLGDVQRLVLNEGDILVLNCDRELTMDMAERLRAMLIEQIPGHQVLVLCKGLTIGVLGKEAA